MATASNPALFTPTPPQPAILTTNGQGSALVAESTLHQLSPYIGKLKSSIAGALISQFTAPGDLLYDPFSGSGTVVLEAWMAGRNIVANDLSPYAALLTRAKLFPYDSLGQATIIFYSGTMTRRRNPAGDATERERTVFFL